MATKRATARACPSNGLHLCSKCEQRPFEPLHQISFNHFKKNCFPSDSILHFIKSTVTTTHDSVPQFRDRSYPQHYISLLLTQGDTTKFLTKYISYINHSSTPSFLLIAVSLRLAPLESFRLEQISDRLRNMGPSPSSRQSALPMKTREIPSYASNHILRASPPAGVSYVYDYQTSVGANSMLSV